MKTSETAERVVGDRVGVEYGRRTVVGFVREDRDPIGVVLR